MNYKVLSDLSLHEAVTENFKREDQATYEVLCSLREVEKRRLFLKYPDCTCLFDYCVKIQKRSEGATSRRISAMRLMKDDPVIEEKFESGELSLSNAVQIAKFSSHIGATPEQKRKLVEKSLGMSQAKCKSVIAEMYPAQVSNLVDFKFTIEKKTEEKFRALKDMLAHQNPEGTDSALFALLVEKAHREEMKKRERKPETTTAAAAVKENEHSESAARSSGVNGEKVRNDESRTVTAAAAVNQKPTPKNPRAFSQRVSTTRILYARANHHCEWPGCTSRYKLERDHIVPIAHGGLDTLENLRLLCRTHHAEASRHAGFSGRLH